MLIRHRDVGVLVCVGVGEFDGGPDGYGGDEPRAAVEQRVDDLQDVRLQGMLAGVDVVPGPVLVPERGGRGLAARTSR